VCRLFLQRDDPAARAAALAGGYLPDEDDRAPWLAPTRALARQALAVETRGQNSFLNTRGFFGPAKVATLGPQWSGQRPLRGRRAQLFDAAQQARRFNTQQGAA